jgi:D-glucosaminate-6-phosphate ammonia-lyase
MHNDRSDYRKKLGLRAVINVSGTMTALGGSIVVPQAREAIGAILPEFVEINDLQRKASQTIARLCGAEAGFVTASASAGITVAVAGAITGTNLARIYRLPDTDGLKNEVLIQYGHSVSYGAPVQQAIRLAGARVISIGTVNRADLPELAGNISDSTAAALYVVSHHTQQFGQIPLGEFAAVCRERGVPVIADLASEYDLSGFLAQGADVAIYSAHKFLGGPTAGIVAGGKELIRSAYLQNMGIGRGMKVGKEGIAGTIAALEAWETRDHHRIRATERSYLELWLQAFSGQKGVTVSIVEDPTDNPLDRLKLQVDPHQCGLSAWQLAESLAQGDPPVIVRDHEIERGWFYLDPCNLHPGEVEIVSEAILAILRDADGQSKADPEKLSEIRARKMEATLRWPD